MTELFRIGFSVRGVPKPRISADNATTYSELLVNDIIRIGIWHESQRGKSEKFNNNKHVASFGSILFPICFAMITSVLSYKGVELLNNSLVLCLILSALSVIPALAIELIGNSRIFSQFHEKMFDYSSLPHTAVIREYRRLTTILIISLVVMGTISVLNGAVIAFVEVDNFFSFFTIPLIILSSVGEIITKAFMATDLGYAGCKLTLPLISKSEIKTEILKEQQIERLLNILQNGNEDEFQGFYEDLLENPELTAYMEKQKHQSGISCTYAFFNRARSYAKLNSTDENDVSSVQTITY